MYMNYRLLLPSLIAVSLFGAGCPLPYQSPTSSRTTPVKIPSGVAPTSVASANGFGKLPVLEAATASPRSSSASAVPSPLAANAPEKAVDGSTAMIARPIPIPPNPPKPTTITYDVTSDLPTWGSEDDVLRTRKTDYAASSLVALAQATGLPNEALGNTPSIQGLNFAWRDQEKFDWNYDAAQRMVSFWKQTNDANAEPPQKDVPKYEDADMVRLTDEFLSRHGFGGIVRGKGVIVKPWGDTPAPEGVTSPNMPCPIYSVMEKSVSNAGTVSVGSSGGGVAQAQPGVVSTPPAVDAITPSFAPCWVTQQISVTYDAMRDGKSIKDASGSSFSSVTITINLTDRSVSGGSIWLDQNVDASRYPLIDRAEALKRLQSGGRNPIWPWMETGGTIAVRIKTVSLAWMRYDVWTNEGNETYYIPALAGDGEVEYAKDNIQPYHTVVPLVADEAFEPVKPPTPLPLRGETGGGSAGVAPAETGTVAPSKQ